MCHAIAYAFPLEDGFLESSRGACSFFVCHSALNEERSRGSMDSSLHGKQGVHL